MWRRADWSNKIYITPEETKQKRQAAWSRDYYRRSFVPDKRKKQIKFDF
jgi:hypothetical protein